MENEKQKKILFALIPIVIALLSFFVIARFTSSTEFNAKTIQSLDDKKTTVMELAAASTAASAAITLIPGDVGTPIANKLADLSSYFLIVLCAIYLEKYLVTITGYAAFKIFIPVACVLFAVNMAAQNRSVDKLARRLLIFGICIFLVVPTSVKVSDLIETTYQSQIDATLEDAKSTREMLENSSDSGQKQNEQTQESEMEQTSGVTGLLDKAKDALSSAKDSVTTAVGNVTISSEELVQKVQDSLNHFVEAVAVMLITSCVIPILVLLIFFWLIKVLLDVDISGGNPMSGAQPLNSNT